MNENIGTPLPFDFFFTTIGVGQTGLIVTIDVYRNAEKIITDGVVMEIGDGFYHYDLAQEHNTIEGVYKAVAKTITTTVDQQHIPAAWHVNKADIEKIEAIKAKTDLLPANPADASDVSIAISSTIAAEIASGVLAIEAGYTLQQTIDSTITQDLNTATKLWLAVKEISNIDIDSIIFLEQTDGLTRVNKQAYTLTNHGSLTVSGSSGAWEVLIHIDEEATLLLFGKNGVYDAGLKARIGNDEISIWDGQCSISDGVIRTI